MNNDKNKDIENIGNINSNTDLIISKNNVCIVKENMFDNNIKDNAPIPYKAEELYVIVQELTNKYTSFESSSVTYETANQLMEAVVYCIKMSKEYELSARDAFENGYGYVIQMVRDANNLYSEIISNFNDYGCRCYRDTIIKGMPAFFVNYDARYCPQDEILTLDYPTVRPLYNIHGINRIYLYLYYTNIEQRFLRMFNEDFIRNTLEEVMVDYEDLYFDNICCAVVEKALVNYIGEERIKMSLKNSSKEDMIKKLECCLKKMIDDIYIEKENVNDIMYNNKMEKGEYIYYYLKNYMKDLVFILYNRYK